MIITIEGMDSCGKNWLAKRIAEKFNLTYYDTDYKKERVKTEYFRNFVFGMLHTENQTYNSFDNFVKPRYHLSQHVYSKISNDWVPEYSIDKMLECCLHRHITLLIVPTYAVHGKISELKGEECFDGCEFDFYDKAFKTAFGACPGIRQTIINNGNLEKLWMLGEKAVLKCTSELLKL